jgi:hypothetical protein
MTAPAHVSRDDIEQSLRALHTGVTERVESAKGKLIAGAAAVAVLVLLVTFMLGKRKGTRRSTIVEIRRV